MMMVFSQRVPKPYQASKSKILSAQMTIGCAVVRTATNVNGPYIVLSQWGKWPPSHRRLLRNHGVPKIRPKFLTVMTEFLYPQAKFCKNASIWWKLVLRSGLRGWLHEEISDYLTNDLKIRFGLLVMLTTGFTLGHQHEGDFLLGPALMREGGEVRSKRLVYFLMIIIDALLFTI